ncbi:MAG: carboxypeptidase-like regulatory domain-containing protein, partial [Candidatus Sulfotelmatobacter sp.]
MPRTSLCMISSCIPILSLLVLVSSSCVLSVPVSAQDAATGAIHGTVVDLHDLRIPGATIAVVDTATGSRYSAISDAEGRFAIDLLPPGDYSARVVAQDMSPQITPQLHVDVGAAAELQFRLSVAGALEHVSVSGAPALVDTESTAIGDLPLNGRRFSDLMLLSPGVTQDPRSLTSATNGDLSFGGLRGFQNSFLVDGGDFNNAFFAQARGLYRAPYQFSNEVVQEFRVSSNSYGAEMGRAGGAVINVVTKSGTNHWHGTGLYYIRDSAFGGAATPFMSFKPHSEQQQGGATLGGPLKRNKIFFFAGFDQHYFRVPDVVEFLDGSMQVVPQAGTGPYSPGDYEASDQALVFAAAAQLTSLAGSYPAAQIGNASYAKLDINLTPRNQLALRYNSSRYWGSNNVFLDPASPVNYDSISNNGTEDVSTDTGSVALVSGLTPRLISHLRAQFSRDLRQSFTNTTDTLVKVSDIIDGIGRSDQLPRATRERRGQLAETLSFDTSRHSFKFGGDSLITWIYDYFPSQQSGEYLFDIIKVDPFTFEPMEGGLPLTPLRAYAHSVPKYYLQSFGPSFSNPNSNDYAAFAQDTIR